MDYYSNILDDFYSYKCYQSSFDIAFRIIFLKYSKYQRKNQ